MYLYSNDTTFLYILVKYHFSMLILKLMSYQNYLIINENSFNQLRQVT